MNPPDERLHHVISFFDRYSPVDVYRVSTEPNLFRIPSGFKIETEGYADCYLTGHVLKGLEYEGEPYAGAWPGQSVDDTRNALNLWRSMLWRSKQRKLKPLVILTAERFEKDSARIKGDFVFESFEGLVSQAKGLTHSARCIETLENLFLLYGAKGGPESLPYFVPTRIDGQVTFAPGDFRQDDGMTYGCDNQNGPFVYMSLMENGLIRIINAPNLPRFQITPAGYEALETHRRGSTLASKEVFIVQRYSTVLNEFLAEVKQAVKTELDCKVGPVWDEEHIDKIDERIFRKIRSASVVVVDISPRVANNPDRFNVGLELGYAYALNKPIVLMKRKASKGEKEWEKRIPFDVSTLNCLEYEMTDEGKIELTKKLIARIGLAFDLIALK